MNRIMLQIYTSESKEAVRFYSDVFSVPPKNEALMEDGNYYHCELELDGNGTVLAVAHAQDNTKTAGDTMQFCLHFNEDERDRVTALYESLTPGANITFPLGSTPWSDCMFGLVDRFGVNWCIFC